MLVHHINSACSKLCLLSMFGESLKSSTDMHLSDGNGLNETIVFVFQIRIACFS